jgi:aminoglycoside phosphotransferase (APT) family kinase protein
MSAGKMHIDEIDVNVSLVRRLLAVQFPQWADLLIDPVHCAGTDNAIFRLGDDMSVRLPRIHNATLQVDKEHLWLPRLAPHLPLAIPVPLAKGTPGEGYPWQWSVYLWLKGENATIEHIADKGQAARDLAHFIAALQQIDPTGGPPPGSHNSFRGEPLPMRDAETRAAIATLHGMLDVDTVAAAWEVVLQAPAWEGAPVWIHGDLSPLNLLVERGRLSAVIDFGCLGIGDPACDLQVAWNLLSTQTRDIFRSALQVDDAMWTRGRGWALSVGLIALPYYQSTNPVLASISRRAIDEVLTDYKRTL